VGGAAWPGCVWRESECPERRQGLLQEARGHERAARAQLDTALAALDAREEQVRQHRAPGAPAAPRGPGAGGGARRAPALMGAAARAQESLSGEDWSPGDAGDSDSSGAEEHERSRKLRLARRVRRLRAHVQQLEAENEAQHAREGEARGEAARLAEANRLLLLLAGTPAGAGGAEARGADGARTPGEALSRRLAFADLAAPAACTPAPAAGAAPERAPRASWTLRDHLRLSPAPPTPPTPARGAGEERLGASEAGPWRARVEAVAERLATVVRAAWLGAGAGLGAEQLEAVDSVVAELAGIALQVTAPRPAPPYPALPRSALLPPRAPRPPGGVGFRRVADGRRGSDAARKGGRRGRRGGRGARGGGGGGGAARGGVGGEELEAERGLQRRREQALLAQMARLEAEVARLRSERAGEGVGAVAGPGAPGAGARSEEPGGAARRGSSGSGGARGQAEVLAMASATEVLGDAGEGEATSSAGETEASGRSDGRAWGEQHARAVSVHWDEVCTTPAPGSQQRQGVGREEWQWLIRPAAGAGVAGGRTAGRAGARARGGAPPGSAGLPRPALPALKTSRPALPLPLLRLLLRARGCAAAAGA